MRCPGPPCQFCICREENDNNEQEEIPTGSFRVTHNILTRAYFIECPAHSKDEDNDRRNDLFLIFLKLSSAILNCCMPVMLPGVIFPGVTRYIILLRPVLFKQPWQQAWFGKGILPAIVQHAGIFCVRDLRLGGFQCTDHQAAGSIGFTYGFEGKIFGPATFNMQFNLLIIIYLNVYRRGCWLGPGREAPEIKIVLDMV
jgi:hypothetical protein